MSDRRTILVPPVYAADANHVAGGTKYRESDAQVLALFTTRASGLEFDLQLGAVGEHFLVLIGHELGQLSGVDIERGFADHMFGVFIGRHAPQFAKPFVDEEIAFFSVLQGNRGGNLVDERVQALFAVPEFALQPLAGDDRPSE